MPLNAVIRKSMIIMCALAATGAFANNVTIRPAKPTHLLFVPEARVNPSGDMVIGFHEISYAMPGNLQVQASIIDNIGKVNLGVKYGIAPNMAIGGGLASTLIDMGKHGIPRSDSRVGLYLTYDFQNSQNLNMGITPNTQIGNNGSVGIDFGLRSTPVDFWSFLFEAGASVQMWNDFGLYLYTFGGLRIHPPTVPFLYVTLGVGTKEVNVEYPDHNGKWARAFFDVMVCFKTGK